MAKQQKVGVRLDPTQARAAVAAAAAAFPPGNPQGVVGVAAGRKRVRGRRTSVPALLAFVTRKLDDPGVPIEPVAFEHRGARRELMPDVIATGGPVAMVAGGQPSFDGLYAGSALRVQSTKAVVGAVTCLLGPADGPTHLLTAGHLFAPGASNAEVKAARGRQQPEVVVGRLARNLLDDPGQGEPLDAALVALTAEGRHMALTTGLVERLPRLDAKPFESAYVASVWLKVFLPTTGDYVGGLGGDFSPSTFYASSPFGGEQTLRDVIVTDFARNVEGDSGTVLMTERGDPAPRAVGVAIAYAGAVSLHTPLDRALRRLAPSLGKRITIWSH